ncbi:MAG: DNA polymerase ligase N-terminal domain-containing protein [Planctomycetota bacterium]
MARIQSGRFTVSEHSTTPLHWDLFIERQGTLKTWSLASPPVPGAFSIEALQHFDHRLAYLDYEGEISGGRGRVKRLDTGTCIADWGETRIILELSGALLAGKFLLEFRNPGPRPAWDFRRI